MLNAFQSQTMYKDYNNETFDKLWFSYGLKESKASNKKMFQMQPEMVQVQAALYLGSVRISGFSYTEPVPFNNDVDLSEVSSMRFYRIKDQLEKRMYLGKKVEKESKHNKSITPLMVEFMEPEERTSEILVKDLPSHVRVCLNVIVIPEKKADDKQNN